ncbi:D-alanine--D-alanine ligase family protein [Petrachloros mirabilis]
MSKKRRVMVLVHADLVPPESAEGVNLPEVEWKTEYDVVTGLRQLGHEVIAVGVLDDLGVIRRVVEDWKPHIAFNLLEEFSGVATYDQNVVSYLELLGVPYTGCNPRGLMLARDKALAKKILHYHRIPIPEFITVPVGRSVKRPKGFDFPLFVKSISEEASLGISQASIVEDDGKLLERVNFVHQSVGTGALIERYIEGRELYVGALGNRRVDVFPVWELDLSNMPEDGKRIATARVKWSRKYQQKYGISSGEADGLPEGLADKAQEIARLVYQALGLSGYARIDFRLDQEGRLYVLEANPNPQIAQDEDFADSAECAGLSYHALLQRILDLGLRWHPPAAQSDRSSSKPKTVSQ